MANTLTCPTPDGRPVTKNPAQAFLDELTPIAEYMVLEMLKNRMSPEVIEMIRLNSEMPNMPVSKKQMGYIESLLTSQVRMILAPVNAARNFTNKTASRLIWASMVAQDRPWDHKPVISSCFHPRDPEKQQFHAWGERRYFYDIWSNIHYGYIGAASGFSQFELVDGAGVEQIGSTLLNGSLPRWKKPAVGGFMTGFDGGNDTKAILLGIQLFYQHAGGLTSKILLDSIVHGDLGYESSRSRP